MKYTQVPFHSTDKERVNPDDLKYKFKQRGQEGKTAEEIQEEVKRRKRWDSQKHTTFALTVRNKKW